MITLFDAVILSILCIHINKVGYEAVCKLTLSNSKSDFPVANYVSWSSAPTHVVREVRDPPSSTPYRPPSRTAPTTTICSVAWPCARAVREPPLRAGLGRLRLPTRKAEPRPAFGGGSIGFKGTIKRAEGRVGSAGVGGPHWQIKMMRRPRKAARKRLPRGSAGSAS
jgi:hypothetical protein